MAAESNTQRLAVLTSMAVGALSGTVTGAFLGYRVDWLIGWCCFGGLGFSGGLLAGCVAAALFARLLRPREPGGPEADYDDGPGAD